MKIERISDNQIRCTLTSFDLSVRNLNLGELAYGSEKARSLFREMIQKASNEVGFDAEDIPLMVEAIPLSNESVMLVITKIEDPEELDTRFSKFAPVSEDESEGSISGVPSEFLEGADALMELFKKDMLGLSSPNREAETASPSSSQASEQTPAVQTRIYRFQSLDDVSDAARIIGPLCQCFNTLYKRPDSSQYYLTLSSRNSDPLAFSRVCNMLAEYGDKIHADSASEAYYEEHYEAIVQDQALQKLASL